MKKSFAKISDASEGRFTSLLKFILFIFTKPGLGLLKKIGKRYLYKTGIIKQRQILYHDWITAISDPYNARRDFEINIKKLALRPKISIFMSAYNAQPSNLTAAINSVLRQAYGNWELILGSIPASILSQLPKDERIKPATYDSPAQQKGDYILLMKPDDLLTPNCLWVVAIYINTYPADMLIYTDEDVVENNGAFSNPHFKPDWSPDTLLSRNYIAHTIVVKKELITDASGLLQSLSDNDYYDFLLRATELTTYIGHIPQVLFHCRPHTYTSAETLAAKKALSDAMTRRNIPVTIKEVPDATGCYSIQYEIEKTEKVSIIIPTKDNTRLLKTTIDSITQKTDYPDYEIIVLNNNSKSHDFFELMKEYTLKHAGIFRCIDATFPFNFAKLMNLGVAHSTGAYILMCNNDIEVIHADWMTQMVSYAQHNKTGAVGVKLLYPDNTIQHAGIVLGGDEASRHVFVNAPHSDDGYFHSLKGATNYAAVTAACMMCRKDVYNEAGGMDEALEVEYNDIDLCLKFLQRGYFNVFLPSVELYHYESATRGHPFRSKAAWKQHEKDLTIFKSKWQVYIDNDPFYNPILAGNIQIAD